MSWKTLLFVAGAAILIGLIGASLAAPAQAHESPWGMKYPTDCCSEDGRECHPISRDEIEVLPDRYIYKGKTFARGSDRVKQSTDGHWHACESDQPWCVIVLPDEMT